MARDYKFSTLIQARDDDSSALGQREINSKVEVARLIHESDVRVVRKR